MSKHKLYVKDGEFCLDDPNGNKVDYVGINYERKYQNKKAYHIVTVSLVVDLIADEPTKEDLEYIEKYSE